LVTSLEEFERTALAAASEVPMLLNDKDPGMPIYEFPDRAGPQNLLVSQGLIVAANWQGCSISIVNPSSKAIARTIDLDKYETISVSSGTREIRTHPPGDLAIADGRLFVGQVFSEVILVIDLATHAIVKRITVPGGGEGRLAASADERTVYFASNKLNQFYIIDSATYAFTTVAYPEGGRGCMSLLAHPTRPLLYIGVQRGGRINGRGYPHANCYLAIYDLKKGEYIATTQLAEVVNGKTDDATPACLTYDEQYGRLYVGMFQSMRGICVLDPSTGNAIRDIRFTANAHNKHFAWSDPLSQALTNSLLLSVNRNNCELMAIDRSSLQMITGVFLGEGLNGPSAVHIWEQHAVVSYPARNGLIFVPLEELTKSN